MMRKLAASAICLAMLFAPGFPAGADEYSEINAVITEYSAEIEQIPGVGTMEIFKADDGTLAISINVVRVTPQLSEIPPVLGGFPVVFEKKDRAPESSKFCAGENRPRKQSSSAPGVLRAKSCYEKGKVARP